MDMATFITSAVVAALVSGLISLRTKERAIKVEYVTKERTKWREKVREKALLVHQAAVANANDRLVELQLEFRLILNPLDTEDQGILDTIASLTETESRDLKLGQFGDRVALLLKHDWERAKFEAEPVFWRWGRPPQRVFYVEFLRRLAV